MKLWLTEEERERVALRRKSVFEQEKINEGKNYAEYIKEEIKAERISKEEGEWNVRINRRSNLNLTTKGSRKLKTTKNGIA